MNLPENYLSKTGARVLIILTYPKKIMEFCNKKKQKQKKN